jgi:hypothetical protein
MFSGYREWHLRIQLTGAYDATSVQALRLIAETHHRHRDLVYVPSFQT